MSPRPPLKQRDRESALVQADAEATRLCAALYEARDRILDTEVELSRLRAAIEETRQDLRKREAMFAELKQAFERRVDLLCQSDAEWTAIEIARPSPSYQVSEPLRSRARRLMNEGFTALWQRSREQAVAR
ncbi:MAG: hypothetical protein JSU08_16845 [Acidobacteria bacterium]|nr:hypothetical protein [Acidobacteriota bacterium]